MYARARDSVQGFAAAGRQQRGMTEKSCHRNFVIELIGLVCVWGENTPSGADDGFTCDKEPSETGS